MANVVVRNLPDDVHRALRARAVANGRSMAAEIRAILKEAVQSADRVRMGDALAAIGRAAGLTNEDVEAIERTRDRTPATPIKLG